MIFENYTVLKAFFNKVISHSVVESLRINLQNFSKNPVILVYQMGKVGSSTVFRSLKNAYLPNPVYQVHFLSHNGIRNAEEYHLRSEHSRVPHHIRISKALRNKIDKTRNVTWKIITLVRDPISRGISDFFENADLYSGGLSYGNGSVNNSHAIKFLQKKFMNFDESTDYICTWFDREIKAVFNVDVFAYPFNRSDGFSMIKEKNCEVMILRLEDLDLNFDNSIRKFLCLNRPVKILKSNVGSHKEHSDEYRNVLEHITFPKSACKKIYSSRYARHFYSESMRNEFVQKWSAR